MAEKGKELRNLDIAGVTPHLILLGIHSKMALRSLCQPMLRVRETTAGIALPTSLPKKMKVPGRGGKTAGAIHEGLPGSFLKNIMRKPKYKTKCGNQIKRKLDKHTEEVRK